MRFTAVAVVLVEDVTSHSPIQKSNALWPGVEQRGAGLAAVPELEAVCAEAGDGIAVKTPAKAAIVQYRAKELAHAAGRFNPE